MKVDEYKKIDIYFHNDTFKENDFWAGTTLEKDEDANFLPDDYVYFPNMVIPPESYTDFNPVGSGTPMLTPFSTSAYETDSSDNDSKDSLI